MKIGYARVSTSDQNLSGQVEVLKQAGCKKIFKDKSTGRNTDREQFKLMMDFCREGDTIVVYDFSRISRSLQDLLNIISELEAKNVSFVSIKENMDLHEPSGKLFLSIIGAINSYQIQLQAERQALGIKAAKAAGKYKNCGRKEVKKPDNWAANYELWEKRLITSTEFMSRTGLKRTTFYKLLKTEKEERSEAVIV